jgi:D-galactarolactone cycloisomerase
MNRRDFLLACPALAGASAALSAAAPDELKAVKITRVVGFRHDCPRPRIAGKNARLGVHGKFTRDQVLRIETDAGVYGIGSGRADREQAARLVGKRLADVWKPGLGVVSPLGRADHALFDLVGKVLKVPAWKLLGGKGPERVAVYDGGVYFNDLLPEFEKQGVGRLVEEVEGSLKTGHRAFKIKVGRGFKWMEKEAGFRRDVEVVKAIRKTVGKGAKLMADANNGYDPATARRFLDTVGGDLFFVEEMFPEAVKEDLGLKQYIREKGWKTRVADGESAREVKHFDPYIEADALDVLQPDVRAFGLTLQWEQSRRIAKKPGLELAPHNWGSHLGLYMELILGRGLANFLLAEDDRSTSDLFDPSGWEFREGTVKVPDVPGCGLVVREEVYRKKYLPGAWGVGRGA